jgi:hypothetical protein
LTVEFGKDFVGGLGPGEGLAVLVPVLAEPTDGGSEIGDAGEVAAAQPAAWIAAGDLLEEGQELGVAVAGNALVGDAPGGTCSAANKVVVPCRT